MYERHERFLPWTTLCCVVFILTLATPALAVIEMPRGEPLPFAWTPPAEGAESYRVYVDCNDGERTIEYRTAAAGTTIYADHCDTIRLRVAAVMPDTELPGPLSDPSDTIMLVGASAPPPTLSAPRRTPQDLDGDGRADLHAWSRTTGKYEAFSLAGGSAALLSELPDLGSEEYVVGDGDLDGDGFSDLELLDFDTGVLRGVLMKDGQPFAESVIAQLPAPWTVVGAGDHDGDGRCDLLLQDDTGQLEIWVMEDLFVHSAVPIAAVPPAGARFAGSGDFDGDGTADVLWWSPEAGLITTWLTDLGTVLAAETSDLGDRFARVVAVGDFDGDGNSDVAIEHVVSHKIEFGWIESGRLVGTELIGLAPSGRRHVVTAEDVDGDGRDDLILSDRRRNVENLRMDDGTILNSWYDGEAGDWWILNVGEGLPAL